MAEKSSKVRDLGARQYANGTVSDGRYIVAAGDAMSMIGERFDMPWQDVARANNLAGTNPVIHPGDRLVIPSLKKPAPPPKFKDNGPRDHARGTVSGGKYIVAQGDTPYSIGLRFGLPWEKIAQANNLGVNAMIHPGDRLVIHG